MNIYKKLLKLQSKLKVPKNQFNSFGKYNFRSDEDILQNAKPHLFELNLLLTLTDEIIVRHIAETNPRFYVKSTAKLVDIEDNESISVTAYDREEEVKKGMDASQITGAVSSYARKYALNGLLLLDDNKDSDSTNTHSEDETKKTDTDSGQNFVPTSKQQAVIKNIMRSPEMENHKRELRQIYSTLNNEKAVHSFINEIREIQGNERRRNAS